MAIATLRSCEEAHFDMSTRISQLSGRICQCGSCRVSIQSVLNHADAGGNCHGSKERLVISIMLFVVIFFLPVVLWWYLPLYSPTNVAYTTSALLSSSYEEPSVTCRDRIHDVVDAASLFPQLWRDSIASLACAARNASTIRQNQNYVANTLASPRVGTAVIHECRLDSLLEDLIEWMAFVLLPHGWGILFQHCSTNAALAARLQSRLPVGSLTLRMLDTSNFSWAAYNAAMCSRPFWESMPTELVLKFELDSVLVNYSAMTPFFRWEYVGAPWGRSSLPDSTRVGNSGFSLRSRSACLRLIDRSPPYKQGAEDWWFVLSSGPPPSRPGGDEAEAFAVETVFHPSPAGYHKPWKYISADDIQSIYARIERIADDVRATGAAP